MNVCCCYHSDRYCYRFFWKGYYRTQSMCKRVDTATFSICELDRTYLVAIHIRLLLSCMSVLLLVATASIERTVIIVILFDAKPCERVLLLSLQSTISLLQLLLLLILLEELLSQSMCKRVVAFICSVYALDMW